MTYHFFPIILLSLYFIYATGSEEIDENRNLLGKDHLTKTTCYTYSDGKGLPPKVSTKFSRGSLVCAQYCYSCLPESVGACKDGQKKGCCQPNTWQKAFVMIDRTEVSKMKKDPSVYANLQTCTKNKCNNGGSLNCKRLPISAPVPPHPPALPLVPKNAELTCNVGSTGRGIRIGPESAGGSAADFSCVTYCRTCEAGQPGTCAKSGMLGCCAVGMVETVYGVMSKKTLMTSRFTSSMQLQSCDSNNCNSLFSGPTCTASTTTSSPTPARLDGAVLQPSQTRTSAKPSDRQDFYYGEGEQNY